MVDITGDSSASAHGSESQEVPTAHDPGAPTSVGYGGDGEVWIRDVHVANIRHQGGHAEQADRPFVVESLSGTVLKALADRHAAELWIALHSDDIAERELGRVS